MKVAALSHRGDRGVSRGTSYPTVCNDAAKLQVRVVSDCDSVSEVTSQCSCALTGVASLRPLLGSNIKPQRDTSPRQQTTTHATHTETHPPRQRPCQTDSTQAYCLRHRNTHLTTIHLASPATSMAGRKRSVAEPTGQSSRKVSLRSLALLRVHVTNIGVEVSHRACYTSRNPQHDNRRSAPGSLQHQ
jgi:hypothetical protein